MLTDGPGQIYVDFIHIFTCTVCFLLFGKCSGGGDDRLYVPPTVDRRSLTTPPRFSPTSSTRTVGKTESFDTGHVEKNPKRSSALSGPQRRENRRGVVPSRSDLAGAFAASAYTLRHSGGEGSGPLTPPPVAAALGTPRSEKSETSS